MERIYKAAGLGLFGALALLASSCANETTASPPGVGDTTESTADARLGEQVYASACASCHGIDLKGTSKGPPHLSKIYEPGHHSDASFELAIANGSRAHHWDFGDMPPVPGLNDEEVAAVIAYVREVQEREGFEE